MILETKKVRLELTNLDNISKIIQIESDNSEFVGQYDVKQHKDVINDDDELHLSIIEKSNSSLIGYIILAGLTNTNDSIEFRRIVVSEKGKGFGKDSLTLVKKHCFENLNAHRIWLDVFDNNTRAINLYKSQGFRTEGLLRDSIKQNDEYRSLKIMSILKNDSETDILKEIDHICLIVNDIDETKKYLELLFDLEIRKKPDSENILMCENRHLHFFVKQQDFPIDFIREQHFSMTVEHIELIKKILLNNRINFETGEFNGFRYNNYKWIEWRDNNGIRFECIEKT